MAFPREPDQPYRSVPSDEEIRRQAAANELPPRPSRFDEELQPDLELTEGPASSGRMAAYAIAALLIVGAVFYGVSHTSNSNTASAPPSTSTAANAPAPTAAPPPVRNVTPGPNTQPGITTGMAPNAPAPTPPPQNNPASTPSDSGAPAR
jgi:hypothetical protein